MGLSAPRFKQRICVDPQNKSWADDTSKFGFTMLRKMGWDAGKGLGRDGSGMTEHVKVSVKNNSAGVGAKSTAGDNWLQNTDAFAKLLAELNERMEEEPVGESDGEKEDGKKSKKAKKEKKSKKESKKTKESSQSPSSGDSESAMPAPAAPTPASADPTTAKLSHARYAARAKYLRNKKLATSSSEALTEILALDKAQRVVKEAASTPASDSGSPSPTSTGDDADPEDAYRPAFGGLGASPFAASASSGASAAAVDPLMAMFVTGRSHGGSMPAAQEPERDVKVLPSAPVAAESVEVPEGADEACENGSGGKKAKKEKKSSKKRSRDEDDKVEEASDKKRAKKEAKKAAKAAKKQKS